MVVLVGVGTVPVIVHHCPDNAVHVIEMMVLQVMLGRNNQ
jgi:hypothetical protein